MTGLSVLGRETMHYANFWRLYVVLFWLALELVDDANHATMVGGRSGWFGSRKVDFRRWSLYKSVFLAERGNQLMRVYRK